MKNPTRFHDQLDIMQDMLICELVELQAPLSFIMTFLCAYHGPNGHLFGNILSEYWSYEVTEDITHKLSKLLLYCLTDFCSLLVSAFFLWQSSNINVCKMLLEIQKEFWPGFGVILGSQTQVN